ncbi:dolichyl-phosphate beta-D-mannosyltransferase [candidate division TA06 bacterium DG_78]|uniref:Dolichyl-phosphate beta-D-mannosyltransferase n=1 Tax=candidate division TA06 bacterium DG_78 TaxID=1703772 RepID=A0A0S7YB15_UNCT6|nr:MAG: dolichyl-phosphate beta-D-mannosyltransferase [candidate division TA06 bacterium DG_78]
MNKGLVIIPTYNEAINIEKIIKRILSISTHMEILVIDDNSRDHTADIVKKLSKKNTKVHLIKRPRKMGLGTAYVLGFDYAMKHDYDFVFEMDADFSHDPGDLPRFIDHLNEYDLIIGSRYIQGVSVVNWPMKRLLLSYFACLFARLVTGVPVKDLTSGFKCYSRKALESVKWQKFDVDGYGFQIQSVFSVYRAKLPLKEISIIFVERRAGTSKMSKKIIWEAFWLVWKLRFGSLFRKNWFWKE